MDILKQARETIIHSNHRDFIEFAEKTLERYHDVVEAAEVFNSDYYRGFGRNIDIPRLVYAVHRLHILLHEILD